jgi:beta-aspartyl-peptidase (threonine type)
MSLPTAASVSLLISLAATAAAADKPAEPAAASGGRPAFALALHAGAGTLPADEALRRGREEALRRALEQGRQMLAEGRSSVETVEAVVRIMEDAPEINAGRGAVFTAAGGHELDAAIMDGRTRACGAVGGVSTVKNPVTLARLVMLRTPHVLLAGPGAEQFADELAHEPDLVRVSNDAFSTDHRRRELERAKARPAEPGMGTCGCVALDREGHLAAATSTGGLTNKRAGRLGDTPLIGAGTYADDRSCAVSCTGVGEDFIRYAVAFDVSARMRYRGESAAEAARAVLNDPEQRVRGGLIALDRQGNIAMPFNTAGMSRAACDANGRWEIHLAE